MDPPHLIINHRPSHSPLLARVQSIPSPSSSQSSSTSSSGGFDSPICPDQLASLSAPHAITGAGDRRQSTGSMTSWGSPGEAVFKPPDKAVSSLPLEPNPSSDSITTSDSTGSASRNDSPITTPDPSGIEHFNGYFISRNGNISPASSSTSTAPSKGEATPRAELPPPVWPLNATQSLDATGAQAAMDVDMDDWHKATKGDSFPRRKHASLDTASLAFASFFPMPSATFPIPPRSGGADANFHDASHRVVAQSSATGCRISAPLSPPAHYPGSARANGRKASPTRSIAEGSEVASMSSGSSGEAIASHGPLAPRWAHPPHFTNKITGRAWSFSQGQERPEIDFDPELFDSAEPESVQEIMKGTEGRIAIKTTPTEYHIMAWLPGFSINDITISMKGDRTVQIVADLWDEGDHAQWNVLLGEEVDKSAISATFKGHELRVTVKRNVIHSNRSGRSASSSWSAPAATTSAPGLAVYPRRPPVARPPSSNL